VQADAFAGPVGHRGAGELGAVVAAQHGRIAPVDGEAVEFVDQVSSGDVALDQAAEAFTGVCSPSFTIRSAVASLRTTCSGVCFFLVAMLMSSLPAHNVGRKTLKRPGSPSRGQATT
jgi:hypothetical protein